MFRLLCELEPVAGWRLPCAPAVAEWHLHMGSCYVVREVMDSTLLSPEYKPADLC